jgi:hypothetical protein
MSTTASFDSSAEDLSELARLRAERAKDVALMEKERAMASATSTTSTSYGGTIGSGVGSHESASSSPFDTSNMSPEQKPVMSTMQMILLFSTLAAGVAMVLGLGIKYLRRAGPPPVLGAVASVHVYSPQKVIFDYFVLPENRLDWHLQVRV